MINALLFHIEWLCRKTERYIHFWNQLIFQLHDFDHVMNGFMYKKKKKKKNQQRELKLEISQINPTLLWYSHFTYKYVPSLFQCMWNSYIKNIIFHIKAFLTYQSVISMFNFQQFLSKFKKWTNKIGLYTTYL